MEHHKVADLLRHERRTDHKDTLDSPFSQDTDIFRPLFSGAADVHGDAAVALLHHFPFNDRCARRMVRDHNVFDQYPYDSGGLGHQAPRRCIRSEAVFFQQCLDLFPGVFTDSRFPVNDPGHCAGGNPRFLRNVIDRHDFALFSIVCGIIAQFYSTAAQP